MRLIIFLLFCFLMSCQNQTDISNVQNVSSTNYQKMIKLIETEDKGEGQTIYIDGQVESSTPLTDVKLYCYSKGRRLLNSYNGIYNGENFSFNLNLKKGEYIITVEAIDIYGNRYIQKNISISIK